MSWEDILKLDETGYTAYNEERSLGTETVPSEHNEPFSWFWNDQWRRSPEEVLSELEDIVTALRNDDMKRYTELLGDPDITDPVTDQHIQFELDHIEGKGGKEKHLKFLENNLKQAKEEYKRNIDSYDEWHNR